MGSLRKRMLSQEHRDRSGRRLPLEPTTGVTDLRTSQSSTSRRCKESLVETSVWTHSSGVYPREETPGRTRLTGVTTPGLRRVQHPGDKGTHVWRPVFGPIPLEPIRARRRLMEGLHSQLPSPRVIYRGPLKT